MVLVRLKTKRHSRLYLYLRGFGLTTVSRTLIQPAVPCSGSQRDLANSQLAYDLVSKGSSFKYWNGADAIHLNSYNQGTEICVLCFSFVICYDPEHLLIVVLNGSDNLTSLLVKKM